MVYTPEALGGFVQWICRAMADTFASEPPRGRVDVVPTEDLPGIGLALCRTRLTPVRPISLRTSRPRLNYFWSSAWLPEPSIPQNETP